MKVFHHEFLAETVYETMTESEVGDYIAMALSVPVNNSVQEEANSDVEEETSNEKPSSSRMNLVWPR